MAKKLALKCIDSLEEDINIVEPFSVPSHKGLTIFKYVQCHYLIAQDFTLDNIG
ncbi:MAG: hypothetical protein AOA65_1930 [Candidatus Bathyarchaeota archaeon BA1]|nr:MAG: hypothetical protein AOA65_1930 [Candidatus Bathyarchaeota archaeon BA1]